MSQQLAEPRDPPQPPDASSSIARWFVVFVCLAAFIIDLYMIRSLSFDQFDLRLHDHFTSIIGRHGNKLLAYFTFNELGSRGAVLFGAAITCGTLVISAGFVLARRPWSAITMVAAVIGIYLATVVLKVFIERPTTIHLNGDVGLRTFPSGHTATGAAFCLMAAYLLGRAIPRSRVSLMLLGILMTVGVSLSALTFHLPSEVFGGLVLTGVWLLVLTAITGRYLAREPLDTIGSLVLPFARSEGAPAQTRGIAPRSTRVRRLDRYRH